MADRTNFVSCCETGLNVEEEDVIFQHGGCAVFFKHRQVCAKTPSLCSLRMSCRFVVNIDYSAAAIMQRWRVHCLETALIPEAKCCAMCDDCIVLWACGAARRCVHLHLNMACLYWPSCVMGPSFIALPEASSVFLPAGVFLSLFEGPGVVVVKRNWSKTMGFVLFGQCQLKKLDMKSEAFNTVVVNEWINWCLLIV